MAFAVTLHFGFIAQRIGYYFLSPFAMAGRNPASFS